MNTFLLLGMAIVVSIAHASYSMTGERNHLVTMTKAEMMGLLSCVSKSISRGNIDVCHRYAECLMILPQKVFRAYRKCRQAYSGENWIPCRPYEELYTDPSNPSEMFDCIAENSGEQTPIERKIMEQYETCNRQLYAHGCTRPRYYGLH